MSLEEGGNIKHKKIPLTVKYGFSNQFGQERKQKPHYISTYTQAGKKNVEFT